MFTTDFPFFRKKAVLEVEDARKVYSLFEVPNVVLEDPTGGNVRQHRMYVWFRVLTNLWTLDHQGDPNLFVT